MENKNSDATYPEWKHAYENRMRQAGELGGSRASDDVETDVEETEPLTE